MAIAQGILTNNNTDFELLPAQARYGVFGGDLYSTTGSVGMPIAINTTIRQIGFVATVGFDSPSDYITMSIRNTTQAITSSYNFYEWDTDVLTSQALSSPLSVAQGDSVIVILILNSATLTNVNITQILATYDLVTNP